MDIRDPARAWRSASGRLSLTRQSLVAVIAVLFSVVPVGVAPASAARARVLQLVDPLVGTSSGAPDFGTGGGAGATFPGAVLPFGMTQFSPDTVPSAENYAGGYSYPDRVIRGFSLTHFSGAGCAGFGDVPILPTAAVVTRSPAIAGSSDIASRYLAHFDHRHERASPGAYSVMLNPQTRRSIGVQLTATTRTAAAQMTFPRRRRSSVFVNAGGSSLANYAAHVHVDPGAREITGTVQSGNFCFQPTRYRVYFVARFDHSFAASGTWKAGTLSPGGRTVSASSPDALALKGVPGRPVGQPGDLSSGVQAGGYATFDTGHSRTVTVRIGISYTSLAEARHNLVRESCGRSCIQLRRAAERTWCRELDKIRISGGPRKLRALFYTALYHALIEPSTLSDADGSYRGMDGQIHHISDGVQYTNISGWDIYRTQVPLMAMIEPEHAAQLATSLLRDARDSGCLPRWPYANQQTNVMTGDPSDQMLASIYAFGVRGFDARAALTRMIAGASGPCHTANGDYTEREGLRDYLRSGYIPQEENTDVIGHTIGSREHAWGAAATTLEDALADSAISALARRLGRSDIARQFARRGRNWERLFDRRSGYIRPRLRTGSWLTPFNPAAQTGFVEGNSAQYTWFIPQNPTRLFSLMGGRRAAGRRLERFFAHLNAGPNRPFAFLGNEPTLGVPWLYDWLGQPARASDVVRRALLSLYALTPGGMPGNDDGGTMSSWWVLAALGLYPAVPGTDTLALNAPLFSCAVIHLSHSELVMRARGLSHANRYIQTATLDGHALAGSRIRFVQLARGARRLVFSMSDGRRTGRWHDRGPQNTVCAPVR